MVNFLLDEYAILPEEVDGTLYSVALSGNTGHYWTAAERIDVVS